MNVQEFIGCISTVVAEALGNYSPIWERTIGTHIIGEEGVKGIEEGKAADLEGKAANFIGEHTSAVLNAIKAKRVGNWGDHLREAQKRDRQEDSPELDEIFQRSVNRAGAYIDPWTPQRILLDNGRLVGCDRANRVYITMNNFVAGLFPVFLEFGIKYDSRNPDIPDELRVWGVGSERRIAEYLQGVEGSDGRVRGYINAKMHSLQRGVGYIGHLSHADEILFRDLNLVTDLPEILPERSQYYKSIPRRADVSIGDSIEDAVGKIVKGYIGW